MSYRHCKIFNMPTILNDETVIVKNNTEANKVI